MQMQLSLHLGSQIARGDGGASGSGRGGGGGAPADGRAVDVPLLVLSQQPTCEEAWKKFGEGNPELGVKSYRALEDDFQMHEDYLKQQRRNGQKEKQNPYKWRDIDGTYRPWCEWSRFGRYVEGLRVYLTSGPNRALRRLSHLNVAQMLDEWRAEDGRAMGRASYSVLYYVCQPGLAPYFRQRPIDPDGEKDTPKVLPGQWARQELAQELEVVRGARRRFVDALRDGQSPKFLQILNDDFDAFFAANPDRANNRRRLRLV